VTRRRQDPARIRARERQEAGDPRPFMMILQEERARENKIKPVLVARRSSKVELPDE
jgi:hypothetical protein